MKQSRFPEGWNEDRVKRLLSFYESQTEEEAVAEDEAGLDEYSLRACAEGSRTDRQTSS